MTGIQRTLLGIAAFVVIAVGSFIYFIVNWDASKAEPIGMKNNAIPFISPDKLRGSQLARHWSEGQWRRQRPSPALSARTTA
ncbi:MAG: hypothetical protein AAF218_10675 [Pseudomonadota bacterium]